MSGFYPYSSGVQVPAEYIGIPNVTLQAWLLEKQTALHMLTTGGNPNAVSYTQGAGGKSVTYQQADIPALRQSIMQLAIILGLAPRRRSMQPGF
jgi:hypothetical protein